MSITRNRELSQFGSFIYIDDNNQSIGITTDTTPFVGIGTTNPTVKFHVVGDTNLEGNVNITNGTLDASSYTLNGNPLVDVTVLQWNYASNGTDMYYLPGNIGIGTSVITQRLTVLGNVSAGQFISTVTSGTAPLVVLSDTQVTNLNASFIRGKVPPSGAIVGTTDTQTLTNKTLTSPIINGGSFSSPTITAGITLNGSTSGSTVLQASAVASGVLTLPAVTDTIVARTTTDTLTNKTLSAGSNTITGLTNTNLSGTAGITNANLANSTISGVALGSNLFSLSFGSGIVASSSYNGSSAVTISAIAVGGTSVNTGNTIVARDISGDFTAGTITVTNLTASQTITTQNIVASGELSITGGLNVVGVITASSFVGNLSGTATSATNATNATVTTSSTNSAFKIPFANTTANTTGNYGLLQDSESTFTYNPSTNTLTTTNLTSSSTSSLGISTATKFDLQGQYIQTIVAVSALNIDCSTGNYFTKTVSGDSTFTVSNVPASRSYSFTLEVTHNAGSITWFSGVRWPGDVTPTLTSGYTHLFMFVTDDGGNRWRGSSLINYAN